MSINLNEDFDLNLFHLYSWAQGLCKETISNIMKRVDSSFI